MEGNESLVIVPSVRAEQQVEEAIAHYDNVVIMKAGGSIGRILELMKKRLRGPEPEDGVQWNPTSERIRRSGTSRA